MSGTCSRARSMPRPALHGGQDLGAGPARQDPLDEIECGQVVLDEQDTKRPSRARATPLGVGLPVTPSGRRSPWLDPEPTPSWSVDPSRPIVVGRRRVAGVAFDHVDGRPCPRLRPGLGRRADVDLRVVGSWS